jgi:hypothetical protein
MFFQKSIKKVLADRGYKHCESDDDFTRHGDYARNVQYAFSKEFSGYHQKVVDVVFLAVDMHAEKLVIGFFRENVSIENGILANADTSIPLSKFTIDEFEKKLDRLIPRGSPIQKHREASDVF